MNAVVNRYPCSPSRGVIVLHHNSRIRDRPTREADGHPNVKTAVQLCQSTHSGPHRPNRASLMNPMYNSIARTQQCPRKSCSPRQPMAAYMWNGLQPVTSFTLIPNPNLNPGKDLIILSDKLKHILYIELTSPWEGPRMEESHKEKMEKYRTAGLHSITAGSTTPLCVEVGARGTTSNTFHRMCKALGMSSRESKRLGKKARTVAARCSYFIFLSRKVTEWDPRRPYVRC